MKSNSVEDTFELLKSYFHRYMELILRWPVEWEQPGKIWRAHDHASYKHVLLKTKIYHKLKKEMKFHEIHIWDIEEIFPAICVTPSVFFWSRINFFLNMVVCATSLGQMHAKIQSMISLKPGSQMWFREIPIWYIEEIFLMRYGISSYIMFRGNNSYLNLAECRGPQMMSRVCRAAWVVEEVVEPSWAAWATWKPCKFVENFA